MKKKLASIVSILLSLALIAGCGAGGETSEESSDGKMTDIKVSYMPSPEWAPAFVAREKGFFEEEGLNVEFVTPGGPEGFQAMQAGDCEFAFLSMEPALIAYAFVYNMLKQGGIDPEKDVTYMDMAMNSAMVAMEKGEISAAFMGAYLTADVDESKFNILIDTRKEEDRDKYLGEIDYPAEGICTTQEYAKENPETVQAFVNAVLKASEWIKNASSEEIAEVIAPSFEGVDEEHMAAWLEKIKDYYVTDGIITEEEYNAICDINYQAGVITSKPPYEDMVDPSFAENAEF